MAVEDSRKLLNEFLGLWTLAVVEVMSIDQFVGVGNKDTFCQWVETKTRSLGSIKGRPGSIKFGIYERKDPSKKPKNYKGDNRYSWIKAYGDNAEIAFKTAREDVVKIINLSFKGEFRDIDDIRLPDMFKWKIAFLYSNERLIPIYKREVLFKIARHFGMITTRRTKISEIQELMINNKPAELNVYEYMWLLYKRFGLELDDEIVSTTGKAQGKGGTKDRNTNRQERGSSKPYTAEQKHNIIQQKLYSRLVAEHGEENVIMEQNRVDIKLFHLNFICFYEVKSASFAAECVKQALGQILLYSINDTDSRPKKHIVVGQYPPTEIDLKYINFIKQNLKVEFDYLAVAL
ncbi:hypothetical protein [Flavobacterium sp. MK4S-17]|uniref:hypothetical protein n=1 Tax=Flavobacterium sp. MK4S-17 TaxID=2543737 RepID=UPI00135BA8F7|nr:hypothetical protein [Flavobacterium sp. MK4S-17]